MAFAMLATVMLAMPPQESVVAPPPRIPLPRPVANAPVAVSNDNRSPAGRLEGNTLRLALEVVEAAYQFEGPHDPIVRVLAFAEPGKAPTIPGPLLRAPVGTTVHLTVHNKSDSAVMVGGLRHSLPFDRSRHDARRRRRHTRGHVHAQHRRQFLLLGGAQGAFGFP